MVNTQNSALHKLYLSRSEAFEAASLGGLTLSPCFGRVGISPGVWGIRSGEAVVLQLVTVRCASRIFTIGLWSRRAGYSIGLSEAVSRYWSHRRCSCSCLKGCLAIVGARETTGASLLMEQRLVAVLVVLWGHMVLRIRSQNARSRGLDEGLMTYASSSWREILELVLIVFSSSIAGVGHDGGACSVLIVGWNE